MGQDHPGGLLRARYGVLPPQREAIRLFCGCCEDEWQGLSVEVGPYACISPVYGRTESTKRVNEARLSPWTVAVIQDSGAFCDTPGSRLTFDLALRRQIEHADLRGYADRVTHRASYDQLIDEKWSSTTGRRYKSRWSEEDAWDACVTTIQAAKFLSAHREGLRCILSAQGVTPAQYLKCAQGILPYLQPGDFFGLGGFCVLGLSPRRFHPVFREIIHQLVPFLAQEGIAHIHLWGCIYAPALGELLYLCDRYGITLSTDSVGPSLHPVFGEWGYASWRDPHYQRPSGALLAHHRQLHTALTRCWLAHLREREARYYTWRPVQKQWMFF